MTVTLLVNGRTYRGWYEATVTRNLEAVTGQFSLSIATDESTADELAALEEGSPCQLQLDGETVLTGYADATSYSLGGQAMTITGHDRTVDLVDCSPEPPIRQWLNQPFSVIASDLLAPFGLALTTTGDTGQILRQFNTEPGDTALQALRRLCEARGLLLVATTTGQLATATPATQQEPIQLVQGDNLKQVTVNRDERQRYSHITVLGQSQSTGEASGRLTNGATATVTDPSVLRFRPLTLQAKSQATQADCQRQAHWEMANRNGKALNATATVVGWRQQPNGKLWAINQNVHVHAPACKISEALTIIEARYKLNENDGLVTELALVRPSALVPEPQPEPKPPATPSQASRPRRSIRPSTQPAKPAQPKLEVGTYKVDNATGQLIRVED